MSIPTMIKAITLAVLLSFPTITFAHSGRTDHVGCHYNNKKHEFHCHKQKKKEKQKGEQAVTNDQDTGNE